MFLFRPLVENQIKIQFLCNYPRKNDDENNEKLLQLYNVGGFYKFHSKY